MLSTHITLAISLPGPTELIVILVIVLVIFGGKNIPALGEGLGKGIKNFRRAIGGEKDHAPAPQATPLTPPQAPARSRRWRRSLCRGARP